LRSPIYTGTGVSMGSFTLIPKNKFCFHFLRDVKHYRLTSVLVRAYIVVNKPLCNLLNTLNKVLDLDVSISRFHLIFIKILRVKPWRNCRIN
jgi:hypothetical protein